MDQGPANAQLRRLRGFRVRSAPDLSIRALLREQVASARRGSRAEDRVEQAWAAAAPEKIASAVRVVRVSRGVVTLRAAHDAARFEADRWLRGGGFEALVRGCASPIKRVRVVV